jgi:uracil-DNA glycosylase
MTTDLTPAHKQEELMKLVLLRRNPMENEKLKEIFDESKCKMIDDYHNSIYECDFVSPYTKSACNFNADIMFFLQDWSSENALNEEIKSTHLERIIQTGHDESRETNINLKKLINKYLKIDLCDTYTTNLFPFIKMGNADADIKQEHMNTCAKIFALEQINIIRPKIVVCFGLATFNALMTACEGSKSKNMREALDHHLKTERTKDKETITLIPPISPFFYSKKNTMIFCQAHPSQRAQNIRGKANVHADWQKMAQLYQWLRG